VEAAEVESRLEDLHKQLGQLRHEKRDYSKVTAEIMRLHQEQAAILAAENYAVEQSREQAAKAYDDEVARCDKFLDFSAKAKNAGDKALNDYAVQMKLRYQHSEQARKLIGKRNEMTGSKQSAPSPMQLQKSDSLVVVQALRSIGPHAGEFGYLKLPAAMKPM